MITVFSKEWFAKYNKQLCWLANSFIGDWIFSFTKFGHYPENKIVRITPNSIDEFIGYKGDRLELKAHFFSRNEYALRLQKVFMPIWLTFHIWDIITRPIPQLNLGFDTLTVYPDAHVESTSVDGTVTMHGTNDSWATLRGYADGDGADTTGTTAAVVYIESGTTAWYQILRGFFLFDTSALTADAIISAATMSLFGYGKFDNLSITPAINVYATTPASDTDLVNADYDQIGTTALCATTITYDNWTAETYNNFLLVTPNDGKVSKTSISKFGVREALYDATGTTPSHTASQASALSCYFADYGSNKPKLVVTYSIPAPAQAGFLFLMV